MRIAVLDDYQGVARGLADWDVLPAGSEIVAFRDHLASEEALVERLSDFDVILGMRERTPFPRSLLERLPHLKLLITTGASNASFDIEAATALGITVAGTDSSGDSTAELAWALLLAVARRIAQQDASNRLGRWQTYVGYGIRGKTLGILGLGRIGSEMAAFAHAFKMPVIAWSQNLTAERATQCGATLVDKDTLFRDADFITVHLRLSDRTRGIVSGRELALMKPTAFLVNTSRGPIVNEAALIEALTSSTIAGAAVDVYNDEPVRLDHPLLQMDNTVVTPHLGYVTVENYRVMYGQAVEDIQAFLSGAPVRVLNPKVLQQPNLRRTT